MKCDPGTRTWRLIEASPKGTRCRERQSATDKSRRETLCEGTPVEEPDAGTGGTDATSPDGGSSERDDPVCERWRRDREDLAEGHWDGDLGTCTIGRLDEGGRARALRLLNLYRHLAGQPEVQESAELTAKAQACAVLMAANGDITPTPPKSWKCWTPEGSEAAGASNLSTAPAVLAIDRFCLRRLSRLPDGRMIMELKHE